MKRWLCASLALLFYASILPWSDAAFLNFNAHNIVSDGGNISGVDNITLTGTLSGKSLTGDGTGSITGFNIPLYVTQYLSVLDAITAWEDVRAYGAVGDGTTDDTAAIQAALAAANVSAGVDGSNKTVFMPPGIYLISGQLVIPHGVRLVGAGARSTRIKVSTTFAALTSTGAIRLGDGTAPVFGTSIEHIYLDCNNIAGSIGIYSSDVQDNSGVKDVLVNNWVAFGIKFDGSAAAFGSVNDFYVVNTEMLKSSTGATGGTGLYIKDITFGGDIRNNVVYGHTTSPPDVGYHIAGTSTLSIYKSSCDGDGAGAGVDCVKIDNTSGQVALISILSNNWDNVIYTSSLNHVIAINTYRTPAAGGTKTIVDDGATGSTAITITDYAVPLFIRGPTKAQFNGIKSFSDIILSSPSYGIILTAADGTQKRIGLNATYDNIIFTDP
jgi:hypothetical protein